jgi:DNA-binding GntR family transcriptional regulator
MVIHGAALNGRAVTQGFDNLTLSQRVYAHLREEILTDRLSPGTELSEVALSRELEISRGPIREAIGRLAAEGLIKVRPRHRAEVRSLSSQEFTDACQDFLAANEEFHEILCQLSGNAKLQEVRHRLEGEIGRFQPGTPVLRSRLEQAVAEHRTTVRRP